MSELSSLMHFTKEKMLEGRILDRAGAFALARFVLEDQTVSITERLFLKGLLDQQKVAPDAMPIIIDILEGRLQKVRDMNVGALEQLVEQMGRIDRRKALELKSLLMEDYVFTPEERSFVEGLLHSDQLLPDAEAVLRNLIYNQPD